MFTLFCFLLALSSSTASFKLILLPCPQARPCLFASRSELPLIDFVRPNDFFFFPVGFLDSCSFFTFCGQMTSSRVNFSQPWMSSALEQTKLGTLASTVLRRFSWIGAGSRWLEEISEGSGKWRVHLNFLERCQKFKVILELMPDFIPDVFN